MNRSPVADNNMKTEASRRLAGSQGDCRNVITRRMVAFLLAGVAVVASCYFGSARLLKGYSPLQALTFPLAPSPSELCVIGSPITVQLQQYRAQNGRYPASLAEAGLDPGATFFGPWRYRIWDGGTSCRLSNGDYGRYLFVVSWTPERGWYVDT